MSGARGPKNHQWKGGRSLASSGYVLVRVGTGHHLADSRGYAYEHRIVAEQAIGRRLRRGEIVHHVDGNRTNNAPTNLGVVASIAAHRREHRKPTSNLREVGEPNAVISCACGCGVSLSKFDGLGRPRRFIAGHNLKVHRG